MPERGVLPASRNQTIREVMESQKIAHPKGDFHDSWSEQRRCDGCNRYWPCDDYNRAVAALDQITKIEEHTKAIRRITDDKHNVSTRAFHSIYHNLNAIRLTLGSDPDPGVGAEDA